ncbi:MAG TPA: chemotaxis protein CheA [Deltaproteobacteria bacterium]|nr:chemotaxis protein CheA [Deltaproteobacteria bacterium]
MSDFADEMQDIINDFIEESTEALDTLDRKFVELEKSPGDMELLNDIFRSVHTIKGASGFLGFNQMVEVTHVAEDILNKLRKGEMAVDAEIMDGILQAFDLIKVLLDNIRNGVDREEEIGPTVELLKRLNERGAQARSQEPSSDSAQGKGGKAKKTADSRKKAPKKKAGKSTSGRGREEKPPSQRETGAEGAQEEKGGGEELPSVDEIRAELAAADASKAQTGGDEPVRTSAASSGAGNPQPAKPPAAKEREQSIRVDIERLDNVLNLAGELVLARNRFMRLGSKMTDWGGEHEMVGQIDEAIAQLNLVTTDLQLAIMKMRMQPIARVFNKFPRMVRDLSRQTGKQVELVISGEDTELDKTVIEEIGDPLVHLVRNSMDHGIEAPDEREAAGKPRAGTIRLSAYQEGRNIVVLVEDDGAGIDPDKVRRKACEKGLVTAEEAEKISDKEALNFIFAPGFSTAKQVSDISGRGVGMDVVKTNITKINGSISIESEVGKGTKIYFRLPLTLAIIQALTIEAGGEVYALPLSIVEENIRVMRDEIKTVEGRAVIKIRDRVLPIVRLVDIVGGCASGDESNWMYVVVIAVGERRFGLLVDRLHGQEEIVMKSMGEYLKGTEGVAGACITGDGNVVLILDVGSALGGAMGIA